MPSAPEPRLSDSALTGLTADETTLARAWWTTLDSALRHGLHSLWREWPDNHRKLEVQVVAEFTDQAPADVQRWPTALCKYLVNHEARLADHGKNITICTGHVKARQAIQAGFIPADFTCPLELPNCIMREALAMEPGRSLRLSVACRLLAKDGTPVAEV